MSLEAADCVERSVLIPIAVLVQAYAAVRSSPPPAGTTGAEWDELCLQSIAAECEGCHISIGGADLERIAGHSSSPSPADAKAQRLRLHACARRGCESRFYRLRVDQRFPCDWGRLKEGIENVSVLRDSASSASLTEEARLLNVGSRRSLQVAVGAVSMFIILFLLYHWIYGGRIPLIQPVHHYKAAPLPPR